MTDRELLEKLLQEMVGMKAEMSSMKSEMSSVKTEMVGMKQQLTSIDNRVTGIESEMSSVKNEVTSMKSEMSSMKTEIADVKTLATKTQIILENDVAKKINILFEGYQLHNEKQNDLIEKFDDLETSMLANEMTTKMNLHEIAKLKRHVQ